MSFKRKEIIGDCTLYLGDCLEVIPLLDKVDAVITDPPYGIKVDSTMSKKSGARYGGAAAPRGTYIATTWDNQPMSDEARDLLISVSNWQIIWGGNYFNLQPSRCWLVWDKVNGSTDFADCELAWSNLKKAVRLKKHMWNGMLRKGTEERVGHPTQKPVDLMKWCITQLPKDAQIILDPFMGSGTTLVACAKMGRKGIGIELESNYFDIACERVEQAYMQPDFFYPKCNKLGATNE